MQRTIRLFFVAALAVAGIAGPVDRAHATTASVPPSPTPSTEPAIGTPGSTGDYLRAMHARLHNRWHQDFVKTVSATYPVSHPLNDQTRQTTIALAIRWDGTIAEASVKRSSGSSELDRAAMDVTRKTAPFPLPVAEVISDDSYAHVEWTFARDHRACAAGAQINRVDDPLEVALPRLFMSNRMGEALRRVGQAPAEKSGGAMDRFARLYLGRTVPDPLLDVAAAVALAEAGDRTQVPRLRAAIASRATVEISARGFRLLGLDVCDVIREPLRTGTVQDREIAISAARAVAQAGSDISGCRPVLATVVADGRQPTALRLHALDTLVTYAPVAARPVVLAAMEDKDPVLRASAILASVRKGGGRPEMYRLAPMLHDKLVEIRGAASAGMVRAGGDLALEQLYLLGRETDPRPGTWVALELAQMSSAASAEFLGKMVKKNNPPVQAAAVRALLARKDAAARTELGAVKADDRLPDDLRGIASGPARAVAASPASVTAAAEARPTTTTPAQSLREQCKERGEGAAVTWIVENLLSLAPGDAIDVLGAWLVRPPASPTATKFPSPSPSPSPSPPSPSMPGSPSPTQSATSDTSDSSSTPPPPISAPATSALAL